MPFHFRVLGEDDLWDYADTYMDGFESNKANQVMLPQRKTPELVEYVKNRELKKMRDGQHGATWVGVFDSETGEMSTMGKWVREDATTYEQPDRSQDPGQTWAPGANLDAKREFTRYMESGRKEHMGKDPHMHLTLIATKPKYQGKGSASIIIKWGLDKADAEGIPSFLHATPAGKSLYEKFGFQPKGCHELDLNPWGVDFVNQDWEMVRPAIGRANGH